jgi:TRAP-type C4-dicarboxylate transport system permease small subunit
MEQFMRQVIGFMQKCENGICIFLLSIAFVIILSHIIGRYVFRYPLFFAEEISRYCFIWTIMLGASIGLRRKAHTRVEYFINFLPAKGKNILEILVDFCIIGFLGCVIYFGFFLVGKTMNIPTAAMEWPWGLIYLSAPFGAVLMIITNICHIIEGIKQLSTVASAKK